MVWYHKTGPVLEINPLRVAKAIASATRRHAYNASVSLGSIAQAMDAAAGVNPFDKED
jgi:hypothetical protein